MQLPHNNKYSPTYNLKNDAKTDKVSMDEAKVMKIARLWANLLGGTGDNSNFSQRVGQGINSVFFAGKLSF